MLMKIKVKMFRGLIKRVRWTPIQNATDEQLISLIKIYETSRKLRIWSPSDWAEFSLYVETSLVRSLIMSEMINKMNGYKSPVSGGDSDNVLPFNPTKH